MHEAKSDFTTTELKAATIAIIQAVDTLKPRKRERALAKMEDACCELVTLAARPRIHRKLPEGASSLKAKIIVQETRALCEAASLLRAAVSEARALRAGRGE